MQLYYNTIPAKVDTKPVNFSPGIFLRPQRIQMDFERLKTLRKENLTLLFKICQIQRTTGKVDHINQIPKYIRNRGEVLKRIQKIEQENLELYNKLQKAKGKLPTTQELQSAWKNTISKMQKKSKYPTPHSELTNVCRNFEEEEHRPRIFLEFSIRDGNILGSIVLSLFVDLMPKTTSNFIKLCENFKQNATETRKAADIVPHLAGSPIHRIFPNLYFEAGDIVTGYGSTGLAAEGYDFFPDNMNVSHNYEGTISMTVNADGQINSLFSISFKPLEVLNGRRSAFGRIIKGFKLLHTIESCGTKNGKPRENIYISRCGLIRSKLNHSNHSKSIWMTNE